MHFLDTNVLLYSASTAPTETRKRDLAVALLEQDDGALSVQVLQEFYVQATRPTRPGRLPHEIACGLIEAWCRFAVQEMTVPVFNRALEIKASRNYSF